MVRSLVDREENGGSTRAGEVAVVVEREAADQAVVHLRVEDVGDHLRARPVALADGVDQHLPRLRAEDRIRIHRLAVQGLLEALDEVQRWPLVAVDADARDAEEGTLRVRGSSL